MKIAAFVLALSLSACGTLEISSTASGPVWVDVRTPEEFAAGHMEGAINLPHDAIAAEHPMLKEGQLPKDQTLLVYCRSGRRSAIAKNLLEPLGYTVEDVGGFQAAQERVTSP